MTRHIEFAQLHNFRDLGGYAGDGGRMVRWGRLYRSDTLSKLSGDDWERFLALRVRTVIDLRYPWEIAARGRVPAADGLAYHNLSIEHRPYDQASLGADVEPGRYLADRFAEVAADGTKELRQALDVLAAADTAPVVVHCASGKDRTGLLAALVLSLLGVSEDDIVADFALTNRATAGLVADYGADPDRPPLRWPAYGTAPEAVMRHFLADLAAAYGSVRDYAADQLGVGDALVADLRRSYLVAGRP